MGCVQQAVLEFDEAVQAPWRPRLVAEPLPEVTTVRVGARPLSPRPVSGRPSRVGACSPTAAQVRAGAGARSSAGVGAGARPGGTRTVAGRRSSGRVRLTRRARRLAVVLALAGGVALGSWLGPLLSGAGGGDLRLAGQSSVTVETGDTLWSIASSVAGDSDVRLVVDRIRQLNGLRSPDIVPGQVLQLP